MQWVLIDGDGEPWTPAVYMQIMHGRSADDGDTLDFVVRTTGCALVGWNDGGSSIIKAAPQRTSFLTFAGVVEATESVRSGRVALEWFDPNENEWYSRIFANGSEATGALIDLSLRHGQRSRFLASRYDVASLADNHPLRNLLDLWRSRGGTIDIERDNATLCNLTDSKYLTAVIDDGALRFSALGPGWRVYDSKRWLSHCIGQRVEDQPDYEYGCWVAGQLREALLRDEPTLTNAHVLVHDPTGSRKRRIQYTRLTLPVIDPMGRAQLLSASHINRRVDIAVGP